MFGFEKLDVWKLAIEFGDCVYAATKRFPNEERFGLTSQMRRDSVSVSSNVAGGSSRSSKKDFVRFIEIAYGSLMECVSQLFIARRQEYIQDNDFKDLYARADRLARMLSGLKESQSMPNPQP